MTTPQQSNGPEKKVTIPGKSIPSSAVKTASPLSALRRIRFPQRSKPVIEVPVQEKPAIIKALLSNLNPLNSIKKVIADIKLIRTENPSLRDPKNADDKKLVEATLTSRVVLAFAASEAAAILCVPAASMVAQYLTKSPNIGIAIALATDFLAATVAYQAVWLTTSKDYYSDPNKTRMQNFSNWWKDAKPIHGFGAKAVIPVYALTGGIAWGMSTLASVATGDFAQLVPSALYVMPIATTIGEAIWTGIFASFLTGYIEKIKPRFEDYLAKKAQ